MATIENYQRSALKKTNPLLTKLRTTVETAFYGSNMHDVTTLAEAYELAKASPGVIVTDLPVKETDKLGLPEDEVRGVKAVLSAAALTYVAAALQSLLQLLRLVLIAGNNRRRD